MLDAPTKAASSLTLTAPATGTTGKQLTVSGRLSSDTALAAGTTVAVTRTDSAAPGGTGTPPPAVTVAGDGTFSFTDTPPAQGTATYTVSYSGDAQHAGTTAQAAIQVSRAAAKLTLKAPATATRAKPLTLTGTLTSDPAIAAGATVAVTRTDLASPGGVKAGSATVGANGTFSLTDTPPRRRS
ncbi:hypothetical protein [Actinacidiphila oryziradicis]|uniref:Ig-like domain repeat protein n=1 Tax=Actinacidiphila oryziradicis TaxID=2571141 RepID=A0A4U0SBG3_9ACTN|nr:hypothetical protein [Actinacidiphila oryziradicis]TKA06656.1 hypothetical protein FCI23_30170 [Actinacidiphila oryziradicis]